MDDNPRAVIGGNNPPADPKPDRTFKKRWAFALFSRPDKPAGAVAMGFKLYMEMDSQGRGATVSDAEFQVSCGVSDGACRTFKRWLVNNGFIQILVRGRRGYRSEFLATIPAEQIPAGTAAWDENEYRQPIPASNIENQPTQPATTAGIPPNAQPSHARIEPPSGVNISLTDQPTTTVGDTSARGSGGYDFEALNGTAVDLIDFIAKHTSTDKQNAARMLRTNIQAFTAEAMLEAFSVTIAEMATGGIATPYKYLMETARKMKAKAKASPRGGGSEESQLDRISRLCAEVEERGVRK